MKRCVCVLLGLVCLPLLLACASAERPCYLALGDSYAYGEGASSRTKLAYVPLFHQFLESDTGRELALRDLALRGETTTSMIAKGQLAKALAELRFRNQENDDPVDDVVVITIDIGGNDLIGLTNEGRPCAPPLGLDDSGCAAAVGSAVDEVSRNLPVILRALRVAAGPETRSLVLDYFNPYSGSGKPLDEEGDLVLPALNDAIDQAAAAPGTDAEVVHLADAFRGRAPDLTHVMEPEEDFHPNDAGYRLMADLLIAAYSLQGS
jgi:lysophospholipase L1-like esterase